MGQAGERVYWPIIKVTDNWCNMKCRYCFYNELDQQSRHVMSESMLEKLISQTLHLATGRIRFVWHGGEPLLAGLGFYHKAIGFQKKYAKDSHTIENAIQTNGTLVDEQWAEFFKEYDFTVGISIDGPPSIHDVNRVFPSGKPSSRAVMAGVSHLHKYKVPLGALVTLTKGAADSITDILDYLYHDVKIRSVGYCPFLENGNSELYDSSLSAQELASVYSKSHQWLDSINDANFRIQDLDCLAAGVLGVMAGLCSYNGGCRFFFCANSDGTIYPCDSLSTDEKWKLGDLNVMTLKEILTGGVRRKFCEWAEKVPKKCAECDWYEACRAGCPAYRDEQHHYKFCESRMIAFQEVEDWLWNAFVDT
ncbi:radical SAM protein [Halodesulfovibrio aestuarii]|uniref:radical SAM protein n=1 Tax=Halodesulfovibrio aestuarii TaxID=126333 RepID=UPI003D346514